MTEYQKVLLALCLWREAAGEGAMGMLAVALVIRNRVYAGRGTWDQVITKPWQFSSMTAPGDPMLVRWPGGLDRSFLDALDIAEKVKDPNTPDITNGATMYYNPKVASPKWDFDRLKNVASIGRHVFYREI